MGEILIFEIAGGKMGDELFENSRGRFVIEVTRNAKKERQNWKIDCKTSKTIL